MFNTPEIGFRFRAVWYLEVPRRSKNLNVSCETFETVLQTKDSFSKDCITVIRVNF